MSTSVDKLNLDNLPDYGAGSSPVLAPDGKGVIRGGVYISLEPGKTNMSGSERRDLENAATKNTDLLVAKQELEENGTPIAETLGLKMPGDDNFDRDDRERISEAEFAASQLTSEQSDIVAYKAYVKSNEGPAPVPITGGVGSIQQDANGNWFAVTDRNTRDYSIDPKDNSAGPTFGGNVSKNVEKMFPGEVAAAGGSSDYTGSITDIFKDTDVPSQGYAPVSAPAPQGNSFTETLANIFTPFNDTTYENGVLVSKTTGFPVSSDSDIAAGQAFAESMKGAGILGISGKQIPDAPFTQGNTPILTYTGGDKDTRSYEVFGGLDPNAPASMSYNKDGSLFVPYGGKDSYSFDASTNFPGSTDPNSSDYNMSKDLAESGSYFGFKFDESGKIPLQDTKGNYIIDTSRKIESSPFKDGDFPEFPLNPVAELNEIGKAHLLATGDDSKMIVKGPGGSYEYINGDPVIDPNTGLPVTPYDPTGGGPIFVGAGSDDGIKLVDPGTLDPITFDPPYTTCPTPDMLILLADNSQKPAGKIEVGDMVYTAHEDSRNWGEYKVTHKEISTDSIVKVNFDIKSITCSPSHKLFSSNRDEWLEVDKLEEGDEVLTDTGVKARWVSTEPQGSGDVVVLTVEDAHTYVCEGLLSHNKSIYRPPPPPVNPPPVNPPPVNPPPVDPGTPVNPTDPITNPGGFNSSFYGGYQPVTASDVLISNANATNTYFQPREARLNPMFPQGNFEPSYGLFPNERIGIRSLFDEPASAAMYQGIMS